MPSPFPGMDPYLENPSLWPNVHHGLISECQAELNRQLMPKYLASIEDRVYISDDDDPGRNYIVPDVHIIAGKPMSGRRPPAKSGVATIEPVEVTTLLFDEVHEARIEIQDLNDNTVITVIEILNPTNKLAGSYGRKSYLQKRYDVMRSTSHLVEIDLLRSGIRMNILERVPPHEYLIHVSRIDNEDGRSGKVWPIRIQQPLPSIPIPLKASDPDSWIDLQQILANAIARGGYNHKINYFGDPIPPLAPEQAAWAKALISGQAQSKKD